MTATVVAYEIPEVMTRNDAQIRVLGRAHLLRQLAFDIAHYMDVWSSFLAKDVLRRICLEENLGPLKDDDLTFRIGADQYTGYAYNESAGQVTYGVVRIEDYLTHNCSEYRAFREISECGYMKGKTGSAHALVHLVVHELTHVLRIKRGKTVGEPDHDPAFYEEMDNLYEALTENALQPLFEAIWVRIHSPFKPRVGTCPSDLMRLETGGYVIAEHSVNQKLIARVDRVNHQTCTLTWPHGVQERVDKELIEPIRMWGLHAA